jgi:serine phosphatase RsbU (regulator of sigma subunit)/ligand-binding sensor domain-containing protein
MIVRSCNKYCRHIILIFLLLFTCNSIYSQQKEIGFLPITNFSPKDLGALPQNWSIIQDNRGVIYAGNKEGLLEFDGTTWRKIKLPGEADVRSLAINNKGKLFVGSIGEIGYMEPNKLGRLEFISLKKYLNEEDKDFFDVWKTFSNNDKIYFQANNKLFCYSDDTILVWNAETEFHNSFLVNGNIYLTQNEIGLSKLYKQKIISPIGGEIFADKKVYILLPYIDSNRMIAISNKNGSYIIDDLYDEFIVRKFRTNIESSIFNQQIYYGTILPNQDMSIGTFEGVEIINKSGKLTYWLNKNTGLDDENIKSQYVDNQKNLWLALQNGLARIEICSPITLYNDKSNIQGNIESITKFNGHIIIATSGGAFYLKNYPVNQHKVSQFMPINNVFSETWLAKTINFQNKSTLFIEANSDIFEIDKSTMSGKSVLYNEPWAICQSKKNPKIVFVGVGDGLTYLYFENNKWNEGQYFKDINDRITGISEDIEGNLWLATGNENGFYKLLPKPNSTSEIPEFTSKFYNFSNGTNKAAFISVEYNNKMLFGTSEGIYELNTKTDSFILETKFNKAFGVKQPYIHRLSIDKENQLWASIYVSSLEKDEIGFFKINTDSSLTWNSTPFAANIKGQINAIYHEENGITWLGGNEGLFRFDANIEKNYNQDYYTLIREVRLGQDSTIFYGTYYNKNGYVSTMQPEQLKYILPYKYNSLIFQYSAQNIDIGHPTKYSYFLEGYDKKWSDWVEETKKEYTNLPEGEYNFRVKAKNIYNFEGMEASYKFSITPPWYKTIVAYIGYLFGLIGFIYIVVTQYTKYLRQIIKENTAEIRAQKEEIEEQKEEITDSIKYAQRIQKAICPSPERAEELLPEHFVLWLPHSVVSGDFWWMTEKNGLVAIVAADCTGHGVPGAFMSMLGISFLNEIVNKMEVLKANEILNQLRASVKRTLKQTGKEGEQKDGMDLALVIIDKENMKIQYSGAYNPLYLYRNGELLETKADKNPIGIFIKELDSFTNHEIDLQKGDTFYTFSDGFVDQFGGEKGGKFKTKRFKELLLGIQKLPMKDQKEILNQTIDNWRGDIAQIDDIIIVGIRM